MTAVVPMWIAGAFVVLIADRRHVHWLDPRDGVTRDQFRERYGL